AHCKRKLPGAISANLQSSVVGFPGANTNDSLNLGYEDLAVADLPRFGGLQYGFNDLVNQVAANANLNSCRWNQVDYVLSTPLQLGVATLPPEPFHLGDCHAGYADVRQRGTHVVELERFNDRSDQFHVALSVGVFNALFIRRNSALSFFAAFMPR